MQRDLALGVSKNGPTILVVVQWFRAALLSVLPLFLVATLNAADQDATPWGIPAGAAAPDFTLADQTGASRTTESWMGPKGAVLVFFRSADW